LNLYKLLGKLDYFRNEFLSHAGKNHGQEAMHVTNSFSKAATDVGKQLGRDITGGGTTGLNGPKGHGAAGRDHEQGHSKPTVVGANRPDQILGDQKHSWLNRND
jgi:hypothetical protein